MDIVQCDTTAWIRLCAAKHSSIQPATIRCDILKEYVSDIYQWLWRWPYPISTPIWFLLLLGTYVYGPQYWRVDGDVVVVDVVNDPKTIFPGVRLDVNSFEWISELYIAEPDIPDAVNITVGRN